jgi:epoxyqueuosine reductase
VRPGQDGARGEFSTRGLGIDPMMSDVERALAALLADRHVLAWGVADLTGCREYLRGFCGGHFVDLPRAVSVAVPFPREVVQRLERGPSPTYLYFYREVNSRLNQVALEVDSILASCGHGSFPVPASRREGKERIASVFPHRLAARLAGLGWIGKSGLLVRPDVGPRLRLVTVLTNAPLAAGAPVEGRCGTCTACVEACPAGALRGGSEDGGQGNRVDAEACDRHLAKARDRHGIRVCGLCLAVCPWGRGPA